MARKAQAATVVDLNRFKASRARAAAPAGAALPLFDGTPLPADPPAPSTPRRALSDREVRHRERMLAFLRASAE